MNSLGIDLSSMPGDTAACVIAWDSDRADASLPCTACTDEVLDDLTARADAIGIDAPLGWPTAFVSAVQNWPFSKWNGEIRDRLRFRLTDVELQLRYGLRPLSVSTDKIALPAMRAMAFLRRHCVVDRSGDGKFFEVYPAASLHAWRIPRDGYRQNTPECRAARVAILGRLRELMPSLDAPEQYANSAHALDALIASLTACAAARGMTRRPTADQLPIARTEGWIHVPEEVPHL